ncbi:hypothetical protein CLCAR_0314 [Clostridium carboxidivorans P7]|nr:hypothetical protein CLCAR_0314 [Clostridium carboxidivorans P7]
MKRHSCKSFVMCDMRAYKSEEIFYLDLYALFSEYYTRRSEYEK